ncbi:MAG: hypothetical protein A2X22_00020 [Bacteroidetes bacterium GWF2_49_14]|nr:MAG: hypothetical protein A2X22_00020 [Bacteroidetes bacterium GWF2_49_14]
MRYLNEDPWDRLSKIKAGVGDATHLTAGLKRAVSVPVDFHTHCTPGYGLASTLMAILNGADIVDTALLNFSSSSWSCFLRSHRTSFKTAFTGCSRRPSAGSKKKAYQQRKSQGRIRRSHAR